MTLFQKVLETITGSPTLPSKSLNEDIKNISPPSKVQKILGEYQGDNKGIIPTFSLSDFELRRTLGTGSYGRVLLAKHNPTGQFFALKKLRKNDIIRLRQVEHTNNECRLLSSISNGFNVPFIVGLRGKFQDNNCLYLVLDYVPGGELFSLLRKLRTLPVFVAQFYAAQVAYALACLHDHGIIYRDLKPENLLLNKSGYLRMADFGFAKELSSDNPITWTFCGTPEYLAPEIIASNGYGPAVDWWALGILIYEMLTGHPPFYHESHLRLYDLIANAPLRFPDTFDNSARDLVTKLLERTPTKRLGVLVNGPQDVLNHTWFRGIDWNKLVAEQIRPPFKPKVANDGDTSNFDSYPEESPSSAAQHMEDPAYERFPDFPVI